MTSNGNQYGHVGSAGVEPSNPTTFNQNLSELDRQIYRKNNMRLRELEDEIRVFYSYGGACDELLAWLNDDRAYNRLNEEALLGCITAIHEKYAEHGRWSGMQIMRTANERSARLSDKARGKWINPPLFFLLLSCFLSMSSPSFK